MMAKIFVGSSLEKKMICMIKRNSQIQAMIMDSNTLLSFGMSFIIWLKLYPIFNCTQGKSSATIREYEYE